MAWDGVKWVLTAPFMAAVDHVGDENSIMDTATKVFEKASHESKRRLVDKVLQYLPGLLDSPSLFGTLVELSRPVRKAIISRLTALPFIQDALFSNDINVATVDFIWAHGLEVAKFLVDIAECAKCYVPNDASDGVAQAPPVGPHGTENEFDFSSPMNRHALFCQFQRLSLSMIFILSGARQEFRIENLFQVGMTDATTLMTDVNLDSTMVIKAQEVLGSEGEVPAPVTDEKWFYINGIAGEYHWTHLGCRKLAKTYSRDIEGIMNRGDGVLWDLVECAGERTVQGGTPVSNQKRLVQRTKSSIVAQAKLKRQLRDEVEKTAPARRIVVIAHSQGCLLLRLALEKIIQGANSDVKKIMKETLCIFTFGNPSLDWDFDNAAGNSEHLHIYALRTEHFANRQDFVARLGVLYDPANNPSKGYDRVFINESQGWKGHLFASQYSHDPSDYDRQDSQLFACRGGIAMP